MGKKVLVFLLLLSFIGWTKAQQEELQNGTEQSKQLQVFGRNIFASRNLSFEPNLNIPTPENYRLGPGDEVIIDVWGTSENTVRETISPEGSIMVENIGPIYLSGMNMEEAERYLRHEFSSRLCSYLRRIGTYQGDVRKNTFHYGQCDGRGRSSRHVSVIGFCIGVSCFVSCREELIV